MINYFFYTYHSSPASSLPSPSLQTSFLTSPPPSHNSLLLSFQKMVALPYVSLSHDISRCSRNRKLFYYGWKMQPSGVTKSVNSQRQPQLLIQEAPISPSLSILCFSFDLLGPSDSKPHSIWPIICPAYKIYWGKCGAKIMGVTNQWLVQLETHTMSVSPLLTLSARTQRVDSTET